MKSVLSLFTVCLLAGSLAAQEADDDSSGPQLPQPQVRPSATLDTPGTRIDDIDAHRVERLPFVRSLDEVVELDIGPLDLEADVILSVDGEPITRNRFRKRAMMYAGLSDIDQYVTRLLTLDAIEKLVAEGAERSDFVLSEEDIDKRIQETKDLIRMQALQARSQEADPNDPVAQAIAESDMTDEEIADGAVAQFDESIENSVGWENYRSMLGVDASFEKVFLPIPTEPTGEAVHDPATGPVPDDDPKPEWLPQATWDALGGDDNGKNLRQFVKQSGASGTEIHPMFKGQVLQSIRNGLMAGIGVSYFFDASLPDEVFMRVGDRDVTVDELWAMKSFELTEPDIDIVLRELLAMYGMEQQLAEAGFWLDDAAFQEQFAAHEAEFAGTLLPLSAIIIFRGYNSIDRFREHFRYRESHHAWRRSTMGEDDVEDHFREGARLFFERGNVVVDLAYKPIVNLGPFGQDAFDTAEAELIEAFAGHDEDFREVGEQFPRPLVRQQTGGPNDRVFQRNTLRMRMTESELSIFLTGYSFADDIFYNGLPGQMFGPWAMTCRRHAWGAEVNAGVWLAKVDSYMRTRALSPFQGREQEQAEMDYLDLNYLYWSQECVKDLLPKVELPAS